MSDTKTQLRHQQQVARQLNRQLSQYECDCKLLRENVKDAENALRTAVRSAHSFVLPDFLSLPFVLPSSLSASSFPLPYIFISLLSLHPFTPSIPLTSCSLLAPFLSIPLSFHRFRFHPSLPPFPFLLLPLPPFLPSSQGHFNYARETF